MVSNLQPLHWRIVPTTGLPGKFLGQTFLFLANVSKHTPNTKPSFNICNSTEFVRRWNIIFRFFLDTVNDQFSSVAQLCPTLCVRMNRSTPGNPVHHRLPESTKPMSIESVMPSNHLILCRPLLLLPPIPPSIRVFSNESTLSMRWPKYWSFSFSISPSKEIPGLISF